MDNLSPRIAINVYSNDWVIIFMPMYPASILWIQTLRVNWLEQFWPHLRAVIQQSASTGKTAHVYKCDQIWILTKSSIISLMADTNRMNNKGTAVVYLPVGDTSGICCRGEKTASWWIYSCPADDPQRVAVATILGNVKPDCICSGLLKSKQMANYFFTERTIKILCSHGIILLHMW